MKACKVWKGFARVLPFALIAALLFATLFFPAQKKEETKVRLVRIWNIDTFEGGKGSRTTFLRNVARRVEKKRAGVYFLVTGYTAEGAEAAFSAGETPELVSFGVGVSSFAESAQPLPYSFAGGELGGECLAYPWCAGSYALYSLDGDFGKEGTYAISDGGSNLPEVAARYAEISGEIVSSEAAYIGFLDGKYRYLLGTQRDACRFAARGTEVSAKPLKEYCDLYQYISLLSPAAREDGLAFLEELLGAETQEKLSSIGMRSAAEEKGVRTVSAFSDAAALRRIAGESDRKNLDKFLKTI